MEKTGIEMAKNSGNMIANEKLLLEFEVALKALKQNTDNIKRNPVLSKDVAFMKNTQVKAEKVLACHQSLKKVHLSPDQEQKFYKLNHQ